MMSVFYTAVAMEGLLLSPIMLLEPIQNVELILTKRCCRHVFEYI
jgi:hypothetical protein